ncbi:hypothetical protein PQR11_10780 [Paraburkholderia strydomiana]|uniref:hypothetical protein n=1 Tax=Paraburkholderia TaxID=1822464 RepID=UPI0038BB262B
MKRIVAKLGETGRPHFAALSFHTDDTPRHHFVNARTREAGRNTYQLDPSGLARHQGCDPRGGLGTELYERKGNLFLRALSREIITMTFFSAWCRSSTKL